jgi:beta-lactamase superfamily II metal-dependent hydrolase
LRQALNDLKNTIISQPFEWDSEFHYTLDPTRFWVEVAARCSQRNSAMGIEIEFLPTGNDSGDAIVIREGTDLTGHNIHVVDGGYTATSDTIIEHIEQYYGDDARITHMVLSHADDDHATGLIKVFERFPVTHLWMNQSPKLGCRP